MDCEDYSVVKAALSGRKRASPASNRVKERFWIALLSLAFFLVVGFCISVHVFARPQEYKDATLLGGPAGLTIFAIVVALSGYLRSVAGSADDKREKIRNNESPLYPSEERESKDGRVACTEAKLDALDDTFENLQVAAHFLILLSLTVGFRLLAEGWLRLHSDWLSRWQLTLRVWDALILEWLTILLVVLAAMHWRARIRDERIRVAAEKCRTWLKVEKTKTQSDPQAPC